MKLKINQQRTEAIPAQYKVGETVYQSAEEAFQAVADSSASSPPSVSVIAGKPANDGKVTIELTILEALIPGTIGADLYKMLLQQLPDGRIS